MLVVGTGAIMLAKCFGIFKGPYTVVHLLDLVKKGL